MAAVTAIRTIIRPAHRPRDPSPPPAPSSGRGAPAPKTLATTTTTAAPPAPPAPPASHRPHHHREREPHPERDHGPRHHDRHHHRCTRRPAPPPPPPAPHPAVWAPPADSPATEAMAQIERLERTREREHALRKETAREFDFLARYRDEPRNPRLGKPSPTLRVDDFELHKTLGTGTFARVRLARLKGGGRKEGEPERGASVFALKILRKVDIIKLKQVEHVRNERLTLGAASGHPFVTTLITTFADNESLYMLVRSPPPRMVVDAITRGRLCICSRR